MGHTGIEENALGLGVADAGHKVARWLLLNGDIHIHLIRGTRDGRGLDINLVEETETLQTFTRLLDQCRGEPGSLELPHFATQNLVSGASISLHVDPADIDPLTRINEKDDLDLLLFVIDLRNGIDIGEGIAFIRKAARYPLRTLGRRLARKGLATSHVDQGEDLFGRQSRLAGELDIVDQVDVTLIDDDRDVDVLTVGTDRDLSGLDLELDETPIQVEGTQGLEVATQLLLGVLIVLAIPGGPITLAKLEQPQQFLFRKRLITYDVDLLDTGRQTFDDVDRDPHPIAIQWRDRGLDLDPVFAAGIILILKFLLDTVQNGFVEDTALRQADLLEGGPQGLLIDILVTGKNDFRDRWPLLNRNDQDGAVTLDLDILEESRGIEGADTLGCNLFRGAVTNLDGKQAENRSGGNPLKALDTDIGNLEGIG